MNRAEKKRLLKVVSISAIVIILAAVGLSYLITGQMRKTIENAEIDFIDNTADLALGRVDQISTRDGRDEWRLTADVATYSKSSDIMNLSNVMVMFYFENGETGTLTGEKGHLLNATQNFGVEGNVVAKASGYELETPELFYNKQQDTLTAPQRVVITSGDAYLKADYMLLEVKNNKLLMEGNVRVFLTPEFMENPPALNTSN